MSTASRMRTVPIVVLVLVAGALPLLLPKFAVSILTLVFISALLAASVNMLTGLVGLVSLGHAGIAATAGYAVAWATVHGYDILTQLGLALGFTVALSAVYGLTTMRSRGIVFLMITLALGMIVFGLAYRLASVTGGQNGLTRIYRPAAIADGDAFHTFSVAMFGLAIAAVWIVGRSPLGLAMRGVRDSESRMASLGYSVPTIKFLAVMLSGLLAGASGVLAVWHAQFISPAAAAFDRSALAVVMVILGGAGTLLGPLVGAAVVVGTEHWLSSYLARWPTVLGLAFIIVILFAPRGVLGGLSGVAGGRRSLSSGTTPVPAFHQARTALGSRDRHPLEQGGGNAHEDA